jgi:hypothetical protein
MPWSVGRYKTPEDAEAILKVAQASDLEWVSRYGLEYMPVIYPGFSWYNLSAGRGQGARFNDIPRLNGKFFWSQTQASGHSGVKTIYIAMFDELDEATAILKLSHEIPVGDSPFILEQQQMSDHYLRMAGQIKSMLKSRLNTTGRSIIT